MKIYAELILNEKLEVMIKSITITKLKTETIRGIAKANGMTFVKLNLAEFEEISDMVGFPIKEYKIIEVLDGDAESGEVYGDAIWVPNDTLDRYLNDPCCTYRLTTESRMSYAAPSWLPREENPNGTILLLDDYSRAGSQFMQATMELINEGTYVSWDLPKGTTIVLEKISSILWNFE